MDIKVLNEKDLDNVLGGISFKAKTIARGAIKGTLSAAGALIRVPVYGAYLSDYIPNESQYDPFKFACIAMEARMQAEAGYKFGEWICKKLDLEES